VVAVFDHIRVVAVPELLGFFREAEARAAGRAAIVLGTVGSFLRSAHASLDRGGTGSGVSGFRRGEAGGEDRREEGGE
jgi:hypothetical protein